MTACCHLEAAARQACLLQLSPPALAGVCGIVHHVMADAPFAIAGGMDRREVDLLARVAGDIAPATTDWLMRLVEARAIHFVMSWPAHAIEVRRLVRCRRHLSDVRRAPACR